MGDTFDDGQLVFYVHPAEAWVVGEIKGVVDPKTKKYMVQDRDGDKKVYATAASDIYKISNSAILDEDAHDLLMLPELHESTVLHCLRRRYLRDTVYTYIGGIVLALNPFNYNIPWYRDDFMPNYLAEGARIQHNKPHSWSVAHNTYFEMIEDKGNQCILVSGESGAGKTEAVKIVIKYLGGLCNKLCKDEDERRASAGVNRRILLASPILESFGNAKTGRNDNSSRFGKFLQLQFGASGLIVGSHAINYLLEKSRVLTASPGERVYHSFYQVAKGRDASKYGLGNPREYPSLISGNSLDNASMEDAEGEDLSYRITNECFAINSVAPAAVESTWRVLAGILLCYKTTFKADPSGERAEVDGGMEHLEKACALWGVPVPRFLEELFTFTIELKGEKTVGFYNVRQAQTARDSVLKTLYKYLFDWMFGVLNETTDAEAKMSTWIGLLDIFGFEDFKINSFEQLCINLANETLQNHYNDYVFEKDMEECREEKVDTTSIVFSDNKETVFLLSEKMGVFAMLDEECALGKGTDLGFLEKITDKHSGHASFEKKQLQKTSFTIKHFAGRVSYEVDGFLEKNRDSLKDAMKVLFRTSTDPNIAALLPAPVEKTGRQPTASGIFRQQIDQLMALINSTNPHWIRCIKPHPAKKPLLFLGQSVMEQMRSSGVLETIRIRKAGYPIRIKHAAFAGRFRVMARDAVDMKDPRGACAVLLEKVLQYSKLEAQVGKTKVFLRAHTYQDAEERKRSYMHEFAKTLQRYAASKAAKLATQDILLTHFKPQLEFIEGLKRQRFEFRDAYQAARAATATEEAAEFAALLRTDADDRQQLERDREAILAWRIEMERELARAERDAEAACVAVARELATQHAEIVAHATVATEQIRLVATETREAKEILVEEAALSKSLWRNFAAAIAHQAKVDAKRKRDDAEAAREMKNAAREAAEARQRLQRELAAQRTLDRQREMVMMRDEIESRRAARDAELMMKAHLLWEEEKLLEAVITEDARRARALERLEQQERLRVAKLQQLALDRRTEEEAKKRRAREAAQRQRIKERAETVARIAEQAFLQHQSEMTARGGLLTSLEADRLLRSPNAIARSELPPGLFEETLREVVLDEEWESRREGVLEGVEARRAAGSGRAFSPRDPALFTSRGFGAAGTLTPGEMKAELRREGFAARAVEKDRDMLDRLATAWDPRSPGTATRVAGGRPAPGSLRSPNGAASPGRGPFCGECGLARAQTRFCEATGEAHHLVLAR